MAILLALTASVAAAGVVEGSDPARYDRREAPREFTVRWLSDAVARAARDLASAESRPSAAAMPVRALACDAQADRLPETQDRPDNVEVAPCEPLRETARQGLISLPPPALR